MKNILVTGGAGFIGSNFIHYMLKKDYNIANIDALKYSGNLKNLDGIENKDNYKFIHADILDSDMVLAVLENLEIDTIVHFAAETHVDRSINSPEPFINSNILGTFRLLEVIRKHTPDIHFHHISTDEVYGSLHPHDPSWEEDSPYKPNSPYAASKASSDHLVRAYGTTFGLKYTISNCSNNYGPRQHPEKMIPLCITNALKNKPIPVYGDGKQIRDWLYVEEHCEAIHAILTKGKLGQSYNIGGNNQTKNIVLVEKICKILDRVKPQSKSYSDLITFVEDRKGHDRRYDLDTYKAKRELGWEAQISLNEGLEKTINWYLKEYE